MSLFHQAFFFAVFGIILFAFLENLSGLFNLVAIYKSEKSPIVLVVGILSARENFNQRKVARSTWLSNCQSCDSDQVKAWFILGSTSCSIPPDYRLSYYSCEKWRLNITDIGRDIYTLKEVDSGNGTSQMTEIYQGFTFKVNHPLVVTKLGLNSLAVIPNKKSKVAILDIHSKEIIVEATNFNNASESHHGYLYAPVENILLPKNYEGLILFEGFLQHSTYASVAWDDGGGVITFERVYSSPYHHDSKKYSTNIYSAVSIGFIIHEIESLKKLYHEEMDVTEKWHLHLKNVEEEINREKKQYDDLLFVDSIDFYRNLPRKLLHFYKWLHSTHSFLYVMKTDDDTVINLDVLLKELQSSKFNSQQHMLWSRFRKNWPVNYVGKWADNDYRSDYYPTFPCGAAYIMSHKTSAWLSDNSDLLFPYQGEDVSLGIWLSAINPHYIEDEHFECDLSCNNNSYNRAQLESDDVKKVWSVFEKCKNLCSCDGS